MSTKPKVSPEEREMQIALIYANIGRMVVKAEHLNNAMYQACSSLHETKELPQDYSDTILVGQNLEPMRRTWTKLMKLQYSDDVDAVEIVKHLSKRIDNVNGRRNKIVHRLWFIGWGNEETESYEEATGIKIERRAGRGGIKISKRNTKDFEEVVGEFDLLTGMVRRVSGCVVIAVTDPGRGKLKNNFHYVDGKLMPGATEVSSAETVLDAL
jgi:hypothetical protein